MGNKLVDSLDQKINKEAVIAACENVLNEKINKLKSDLLDLQESMATEGKSSVGDKHETARARMQSEIEAQGLKLNEWEDMLRDFLKFSNTTKTELIKTGDLVHTNLGTFYLSVPIGKMEVNQKTIYAISLKSPLGLKIKGLQQGAQFELNGKASTILAVE